MESDATIELLKDPIYAERVRDWLADPKNLLDHRHTLARAQALADVLEDRVRRMGVYGDVPPPLLYAIDELRKMHLAIQRLETTADETKYVHVSIVDAFIANTVNVLTEFAPPDRLGAALDKFRASQEAVLRGTPGACGRASGSKGRFGPRPFHQPPSLRNEAAILSWSCGRSPAPQPPAYPPPSCTCRGVRPVSGSAMVGAPGGTAMQDTPLRKGGGL
jgi:hypothetical protein